jgi:hypothetical protein
VHDIHQLSHISEKFQLPIITMGSLAPDYKFEGWQALDASAAEGNMVWREFEPKRWEDTDIDIKITHCGICGSDVHTLRSGWVCLQSRSLTAAPSQD